MIDLALAKAHLRAEGTAEDVLIQSYIDAAASWVEGFTGLLLTRREVVQSFSGFATYLPLFWGPDVDPDPDTIELAYVDADGSDQVVTAPRLRRGRIYAPADGWPAIGDYSTVALSYTAGFGDGEGETPVPADLVQAQLMLIAFWFQNRAAGDQAPPEVEAICRRYRPVLI